jgi:hypothetical protein
MTLNPYEAPQTLASAASIPAAGEVVDVGPEILQVIRGAKQCYQAVLLFASSLLLMFVLGFILPREIAPLVGWVFLIVVMVAAVLHFFGIFGLLRIDPRSGARGLMLSSLIATALVFLSYAAMLGAALWGIAVTPPWGVFVVEIVSMVGTLSLILGLIRVGEYLKEEPVIRYAKTALIFFTLLYTAAVIISGLLLVPSIQASVAEFQRKTIVMSSLQPIYFSLVMVATIFYVKALDAIVKLRNKLKLPPTVPITGYRNLL